MIYVIFDIDGTLTATKEVDDKCFIKAFEEVFNIKIEDQNWESIKNVTDWGITEEIILHRKQRLPTESEYATMISHFISSLKEERKRDSRQFAEVSGAKAFFDSLRYNDEINLGIATGAWEQSALLKLESIGISTYNICFSHSGNFKSREMITRDVIKRLNFKSDEAPERIVYLGDGEWDYKTCQNLGIDFIGIDHQGNGRLKELGAKNVFKNYVDRQSIMDVIMNFR